MAIDDNTVYGLTGAQVKELASKTKTAEDDGVAYLAENSSLAYDLDELETFISGLQSGKVGFVWLEGSWRRVHTYTVSSSELYLYWVEPIVSSNTYLVRQVPLTINRATGEFSSSITSQIIPTVTNVLTSASTTSALSANQGRVLKGLIDDISVPTKTSDLTNDGSDGTSTYVEADELATVATSGAYSDLTGTPTMPTVNDSTITVTNNGTSKGTFTTNQSSAGTVALDYPVVTMTTTDPGEGATLAENNFIGVYE